MRQTDFKDLDLNVARARIVLSLLAMLSLYVDPTVAGGLFHLNTLALAMLLCHFAYSVSVYVVEVQEVVGSYNRAPLTGALKQDPLWAPQRRPISPCQGENVMRMVRTELRKRVRRPGCACVRGGCACVRS